jgi:hypothetical protein
MKGKENSAGQTTIRLKEDKFENDENDNYESQELDRVASIDIQEAQNSKPQLSEDLKIIHNSIISNEKFKCFD